MVKLQLMYVWIDVGRGLYVHLDVALLKPASTPQESVVHAVRCAVMRWARDGWAEARRSREVDGESVIVLAFILLA